MALQSDDGQKIIDALNAALDRPGEAVPFFDIGTITFQPLDTSKPKPLSATVFGDLVCLSGGAGKAGFRRALAKANEPGNPKRAIDLSAIFNHEASIKP